MAPRVWLVILIALSSLAVTACNASSSIAAAPRGTPTLLAAATVPAATRTPSGIFISTSLPPAKDMTNSAPATTPNPAAVIVQGRVFDAGSGQRLNDATIKWQFAAPDRQQYNGRLQVPADGLYRLELPVRSDDEVIITADAPGYLSSMARLIGAQLNRYGSRLNFGLVKADGPVPTLPGALGTIQLSGIVYNSARGLKDPIANARVTIRNRSMVQPETQVVAITSITGTFAIPLALHTTDQIDLTISAGNYLTATLTKSANDLAKKPQLAIGLKPVPRP